MKKLTNCQLWLLVIIGIFLPSTLWLNHLSDNALLPDDVMISMSTPNCEEVPDEVAATFHYGKTTLVSKKRFQMAVLAEKELYLNYNLTLRNNTTRIGIFYFWWHNEHWAESFVEPFTLPTKNLWYSWQIRSIEIRPTNILLHYFSTDTGLTPAEGILYFCFSIVLLFMSLFLLSFFIKIENIKEKELSTDDKPSTKIAQC